MPLWSRVFLFCVTALAIPGISSAASALQWTASSEAAFARAQREHRLVILDLEAVWCHWCHVMDQKTYANADVRKILAAHYVPLRLDQDAHPDFAARYAAFGWPATIIFAADGSEIVKRRGYIEPERMLALLEAIVADPSPGASAADAAKVVASTTDSLDPARRQQAIQQVVDLYNHAHGGWGAGNRYVDSAAVEWSMQLARSGDTPARHMARQTLEENLALIDPVWGGVSQYSIGPGWDRPHFEKIMSFQANDLRLYALAYAAWNDQRFLAAARSIESYLIHFLLAPDGAFYVSQDADLSPDIDGHGYYAHDDAGRRALGMPRIDRHRYARENGWAISALCQVHDSLGDSAALRLAERAARWVLAHRALAGGGFRHDESDVAGPYLADNLAMAGALLSLYRSSGRQEWLTEAQATLTFIDSHLRSADAGFLSSPTRTNEGGVFAQPLRDEDENAALARVANLAWRSSGSARDRDISEHAARYVFAWTRVHPERFMPALLLVDRELSTEPLHVAVVGARDDERTQALHAAALRYPALYTRVDLWDACEGPLPNPDVTYPTLKRPAAFVCTGNACSPPVFEAAQVVPAVDRLREAEPTQ